MTYQVNMNKLSKYVTLLLLLVVYFGFQLIVPENILTVEKHALSLSLFMVLVFIHELIHIFAALLCREKIDNISLKICLEKGYASCRFFNSINKKNMLFITLLPLIVLVPLSIIFLSVNKNIIWVSIVLLIFLGCTFDILSALLIAWLPPDSSFNEAKDSSAFYIVSTNSVVGPLPAYLKNWELVISTDQAIERNKTRNSISVFSLLVMIIAFCDVIINFKILL